MTDRHMGVAEVKRHFSDVVGEVLHAQRRIIVERRGRPVAAIVPLEASGSALAPGRRLAKAIGCGGKEGETFSKMMRNVVSARHRRLPRAVSEIRK